MYQSFPQRHYVRSNSAMPVIKEDNIKEKSKLQEFCKEKTEIECNDNNKKNPLGNFFSSLELDDIIIIGLILVLFFEGSNDIMTLALLGFILFL